MEFLKRDTLTVFTIVHCVNSISKLLTKYGTDYPHNRNTIKIWAFCLPLSEA